MSDEEHQFESKADVEASNTYPQQAGTVKKNGYLVIKNRPCKVEVLLLNAKALTLEDSPARIVNIQIIIMSINALSKGFSERLATASRPMIGVMFKQTLDVFLQVLVVFPKIEPLRCKACKMENVQSL